MQLLSDNSIIEVTPDWWPVSLLSYFLVERDQIIIEESKLPPPDTSIFS